MSDTESSNSMADVEEFCICGDKMGWHHAIQNQTDIQTGRKYIRVCYGIGCTCEGFKHV